MTHFLAPIEITSSRSRSPRDYRASSARAIMSEQALWFPMDQISLICFDSVLSRFA
jgi:hypothetical protein